MTRNKSPRFKNSVWIRELITLVNERNQKSICIPEVRRGWNSLLETILMNTNNYCGFYYLTQEQVPQGHLPGISQDNDSVNTFPDETRIGFYYNAKLKEI